MVARDNGNVYGFTDGIDAQNRPGRPIGSQVFTYDGLNRLAQFTTTSTDCAAASNGASMNSGNSYVIDAWANLTQKNAPNPPSSPLTGCVAETLAETADMHNRFTGTNRYDAAGNMTANGLYTYDAENRLKTASGTTYTYDADGNRVSKSGGMIYWQNAGGEILAESTGATLTAEYIFFGSQRVARVDSPTTLAVRFTNDSCSGCGGNPVGGGDRNLFVQSITIGSTVILPSDPAVSYTSAPCNRTENGLGVLLCAGDLMVALPAGTTGQAITVNAYGSPDFDVYPHMQLLVNGSVVGDWDVTGGTQEYAGSAARYYIADHLGSATVIANSAGASVCETMYYPYGGERWSSCTDSNHYKFTGKERDGETGLDYFGARYNGSNMGRFMTPDKGTDQDSEVPQSWNLYGYVRNNPVTNVDPDGNDCVYLNQAGDGVGSVDQHTTSGACSKSGGYWVDGAVTDVRIKGNSVELTGTTNGIDNNTHASYMTNGDIPINPFGSAVVQSLGQRAPAMYKGFAIFEGASILAGTGLWAAGAFEGAGMTSILTEDLSGVLSRAGSAVGNQGAKVASREIAEEAAKKWVGEGASPITDRVGNVVGEISADGTKVARFTSAETKGYVNLVNKITGGNLHVSW